MSNTFVSLLCTIFQHHLVISYNRSFAYNGFMRPRVYRSGDDLNPYLKKINAMLIELDVTPTRISIMAGLGVSTLANLMKRNNVPTISTLDKLCAVFGMPLSSFILEVEIEYPELSSSARYGLYKYDPKLFRKNRIVEEWAALPVGDRKDTLDRMYIIDEARRDEESKESDKENSE